MKYRKKDRRIQAEEKIHDQEARPAEPEESQRVEAKERNGGVFLGSAHSIGVKLQDWSSAERSFAGESPSAQRCEHEKTEWDGKPSEEGEFE